MLVDTLGDPGGRARADHRKALGEIAELRLVAEGRFAARHHDDELLLEQLKALEAVGVHRPDQQRRPG